MPELIDPSEIMFTPFEPKTKNRYIMYIEGIPAYLIKTANRPQIQFEEIVLDHINVKRYIKSKGAWQPIDAFIENNYTQAIAGMKLYDALLVNTIIEGMNLVA